MDLSNLESGEILTLLATAARWEHGDIASGAAPIGSENPLSVETVGRWFTGVVPEDPLRVKRFISENSATKEIAESWWRPLDAAWARTRLAEKKRRSEGQKKRRQAERAQVAGATPVLGPALVPGTPPDSATIDALINTLRQRVLADRQLTSLPALFEIDQTLPLATTYVELRIAPARPIEPMPHALDVRPTLSERIRRRAEERVAIRRPPQDALDNAGTRCRLILGAPGSGKSSLLRRLALDIAAGKWKTAAVPLFVEARAYAEQLRREPTLSLVDYACRRAAGSDLDAAQIRSLLSRADNSGKHRAILLVDGLDEIASDRDAVAAVYGALADGMSGVAWIATARPAGLVRAPGEDQRYDMAELDRDAIAALIDNWCRSTTAAGRPLDAAALKRELDRVPGMREMATNPFLLTALCFLKSSAPGEDLPHSRIAVYEALLARIALQAQKRHGDPEILSSGALRDLSDFACHLYRRPQGAVQIFRAEAWHAYQDGRAHVIATDFARHIVPGRLLTVWHEADPQYHFLHLTLQEHLVARAMLDWPVTEALKYRFKPAWRSVFRFYGALLWERGNRQAFAELTAVLYETRDVNDLSLITLAEIFADAGLRDTKGPLGDDLREELLAAVKADHAVGMEAFIDAIALLDPEWLAKRTIRDMDRLLGIAAKSARLLSGGEHYEGHFEILTGRDCGSPYVRLARTRTEQARAAIEDAFWGTDLGRSMIAAHAYAEIATPADLDRVVRAANQAKLGNDKCYTFYAFALASRSRAFIPFLGRLVKHLAAGGKDPFSEVLSLIADIGGPEARDILRDRLQYELRRHGKTNHQIDICARAVARLGGQDAFAVLDQAVIEAPNEQWSRFLEISRRSITPGSDAWLIERLQGDETREIVLRALADAASFGRLPGSALLEAIKELATDEAMCDGFDFAVLEQRMLAAGAPAQLCGPLVAIAEGLLETVRHDTRGAEIRAAASRDLMLILDTLGEGRWSGARELVESIIDDSALPADVVTAAVTAAGRILEGTGDIDMIARLENILYADGFNRCEIDPYEVTLAIGRIELERLFQLRGANTASSTLEQIAAEKDLLIFEDNWVDRAGTVTRWARPPRKVLYAASSAREAVAKLVSHEISRWELHMTRDWPADCCVAFLIFEPLKKEDNLRTYGNVEMLEREGGKVYRLRLGNDDDSARRRAREIATELAPGVAPAGATFVPRRRPRRRPRA